MCEHHNEHKSDRTGYHTGDKALPCKKCDKTSFIYLWIEHLYCLNFDIINSNFNIHVIIQITYNTLSCKECDVDLMYHLCHGEKNINEYNINTNKNIWHQVGFRSVVFLYCL